MKADFYKKKINSINKIKNHINYFENRKSYLKDAQNLYYPTFTDSFGLSEIYKFSDTKINKFSLLSKIFKNTFSGVFFSGPRVIKNLDKFNYNNIIFTWANFDNFRNDGSLDDKFFNVNSKYSKNTLWIVIYLDKFLPKKINNNIILYQTIRTNINIIRFTHFLLNKTINYKNPNLYLHSIANFSFFAENFFNIVKPYLTPNIKKIFFPFECQPFQNKIIHYLKTEKFKTKIIGYIHAPPLSFPSNYIYRKFSPDEIIVNGDDQLYCFNKFLNWPKKIIKVRPSTRFLKYKKISMSNKIYFPMTIRNSSSVISSLRKIINSNEFCLKDIEIQKHPFSAKEKKIINFEQNLKSILKKEKIKKKNNRRDLSIFIGSTGAIIEALERGVKVIQICEFPVLDVYSEKFWRNIIVKKLYNNVFTYKLKKKGKLIKLGKNNKNKKIYGYKL
ncbi:hypothetical protein [Candidatus Pelagibacter sp. HIMB1321]|uniref:hypothetical protein n=1 Tax=Candidatus Pelagibacter sp. HIMB1321 TaxID=1388755 RepID=UPI0012EE141B|nr:hypothetical protein [Candidatus Pelagibacter sp. HIMB1321]